MGQTTLRGKHDYDPNCSCARCDGIKRYPQPSHCDWCNTAHRGDANNCWEESDDTNQDHREQNSPASTGNTADVPNTGQNEFFRRICEDVLDQIKSISEMVKEQYNMLPQPQTQQGGGQKSKGGGRRNQQQQRSGFPFITLQNLSRDKRVVKIIDARLNESQAENRYNDIVLKCAFQGQTMLYGLKVTNPVYHTLFDAWGGNENEWVGKEFYLFLEADDFTGREFARADISINGEAKQTRSRK